MLKLKQLGLSAAFAGALIFTGAAAAQGGGGGGGGSGGGAGSSRMTGAGDIDRDRLRVQDPASGRDKLQDRDRDRDQIRDPDRDRLYLGTQDRIRTFDRDRDGKVNRVEFSDWREGMFGQMDPDGNGMTLEEFHAARLGEGPYVDGDPQRQAQMRTQANLRKTERFRIMDGNGDGIVTREEYMHFGEHAWLEADANDDGQLTMGELHQYNRGM